MAELNPPGYRVRLFLSVDLTGSTQFKSKADHTSHDWLKAFQKFYGEFPEMFNDKYRDVCSQTPEIRDDEPNCLPKVWKTIGDEILFVNRVFSITHVGAYITAFGEALKEFGHEIHQLHSLNTKGNGWVAAFPSPNCAIGLSRDGGDPLSGQQDLLTEEFEAQVDDTPHKFDFLGKGIDGGFRISRNSTIDTFTISPALAYLLCRAKRNVETTKFDCEFHFHEPQALKGMVNGEMYPVVSIDTNRDPLQKEIHKLQAQLLQTPENAHFDVLASYLEKYIRYHKIEMPELKLAAGSADVEPPNHYTAYLDQWDIEAKKLLKSEALEQEAGEQVDDKKVKGADGLDDANQAFNLLFDALKARLRPQNGIEKDGGD